MIYRYRWFYVVFVVVFMLMCGYQFDVKSSVRQRDELVAKAVDLDREIQAREKILRQPHQTKTKNISVDKSLNVMPELSGFLDENALEIVSISNAAGLGDVSDNPMYQLSLRGRYQDYLNFLREFDEKDGPYRIKDFSFAVNESNQILASFLIVYAGGIKKNTLQKSVGALEEFNPFCGADNHLLDSKKLPQLFPLDEMQLLGTVFRHGKRSAIIRLPTGVVLNMSEGDLLGSEGGRVIRLTVRAVTLQLPDHSQKILGDEIKLSMTDVKE